MPKARQPGRRGTPTEPWRSFLQELDEALYQSHELHCIGGFVITQHYGIGRTTSDIDLLAIVPRQSSTNIEAIAGLQSPLHRKYGLYTQRVTVATPPEDYVSRLIRMFPAAEWKNLTFFALEAHDLALSKLERNAERDREDVLQLAQAGYLQRDTLKQRYFEELRPNLLSKLEWHDTTLDLWLGMCWPTKP